MKRTSRDSRADSVGSEIMSDDQEQESAGAGASAGAVASKGWLCPAQSFQPLYNMFTIVFRGFLVVYFGAIIAMAVFSPTEAPRLVAEAFPGSTHGLRFPGEAYDASCVLTWDSWINVTVDFFTLAHALGWAMLAMITRDPVLCIALSCADELIEVTFRHWLPNFSECWWDQAWDIFFCNIPGVFAGAYFANWWYQDQPKPVTTVGRRILNRLLAGPNGGKSKPESAGPLGNVQWYLWCEAVVLAVGAISVEVMSFLAVFGIKAALGIPTLHWLNWFPAGLIRTMQGALYVRGQYHWVVAIPAILLASVLRFDGVFGPVPYALSLAGVAMTLAHAH